MKLKINKEFSNRYSEYRRKEEKQKLIDRYGEYPDTSSSESEDEVVSNKFDVEVENILETIKRKDSSIYNKDKQLVDIQKQGEENSTDDSLSESNYTSKKHKPIYLKDFERKVILENDGKLSASTSSASSDDETKDLGYFAELDEIKQEFKKSINAISDDEDLFVSRKSNLKDSVIVSDCSDTGSSSDKFLDSFIKTNGRATPHSIPTYDEIVESSDEGSESGNMFDIVNVIHPGVDENEFEDRLKSIQEAHYNYKQYPRSIDSCVRMKDTKRIEKRRERKAKKETERQKIKKGIEELKFIKREEILSKIDQLKKISGVNFNADELDDDFDPNTHNEMMQRLFGEKFYCEDDSVKPVFSSDDDSKDITDWDNYNAVDKLNMDCDFDPSAQLPKQKYRDRFKKKKSSLFQDVVEKQKPVFDPKVDKDIDSYYNEYYNLDYEDVIGDLPCRFKYRDCVANDFGLTTGEILICDDKELNTWCGLKRVVQYQNQQEELHNLRKFQKEKILSKKFKILTSLSVPENDGEISELQSQLRSSSDQESLRTCASNENPSKEFVHDHNAHKLSKMSDKKKISLENRGAVHPAKSIVSKNTGKQLKNGVSDSPIKNTGKQLKNGVSDSPIKNTGKLKKGLSDSASKNTGKLKKGVSDSPSKNTGKLKKGVSDSPSINTGKQLGKGLNDPPSTNTGKLKKGVSDSPSKNTGKQLKNGVSDSPIKNTGKLKKGVSDSPSKNTGKLKKGVSDSPSINTGKQLEKGLNDPPSTNTGKLKKSVSDSLSTNAGKQLKKGVSDSPSTNTGKQLKKRKRLDISDERLKAYGIGNIKNFAKRMK